MRKQLLLICSIVAVGLSLACGQTSPTSPATADPGTLNAGPDGSTLKILAPTLVAPANGAQIQGNPSLQFTAVTGKYTTFPVSYEIDLRNAAGTRVNLATTANTTMGVIATLAFDAVYTWKVRAVQGSAFGPWSSTFTFRTQPAAYLRLAPGAEIFDPLTNNQTVGQLMGGAFMVPGVGVKMPSQAAFVNYALNNSDGSCALTNCAGEISLLVTGVDDGSPGDKSKIFSMQEGPDLGDITDDDYRMTAELRGRNYPAPGTISGRIIPGDGEPRDFERETEDWSDSRWYFWKFTWQTGQARLQIRDDSETGHIIYDVTVGTGAHPYRPAPHMIHIGSPPGRNGIIDATIGGLVAKNLWVGSGPRPQFPVVAADTALAPSLLSRPGGR